NGSTACEARSRACFAEPPAESPSTMNISAPWAAVLLQSASLPGRRSLRTAVLREISLSSRRRIRSSARSITKAMRLVGCWALAQAVGWGGIGAEPVVEWIPDRVLDDARRFPGCEPVLGLALEFGLADEHRDHASGAVHHVVAGHHSCALALAHALGMVLDAFQERGAQTRFVRAAVRRRDRVAIGGEKSVAIGSPRDRPLRGAVDADLARATGEDVGMD